MPAEIAQILSFQNGKMNVPFSWRRGISGLIANFFKVQQVWHGYLVVSNE
jgi:hypothetical protein